MKCVAVGFLLAASFSMGSLYAGWARYHDGWRDGIEASAERLSYLENKVKTLTAKLAEVEDMSR